jgi:1-acyl-sn-glycerol-3-phosphate acyltransferase
MFQLIFYWAGRAVMDVYARLMLDTRVQWQTPLPAGPLIIAANHPTTLDPFLLLTVGFEQMSILVTESAFKVPGFGRYLQAAGHVPVVHQNGRAAFDEAVRLLQAGRTVGIFPEGALSPLEGGLCHAHTGVARLALTANVPVVPVGIALHRPRIRFMETRIDEIVETARWYLRGPYTMTVGEPLYFKGAVDDRACVRAVTDRILSDIARLEQQSAARVARDVARLSRSTALLPVIDLRQARP